MNLNLFLSELFFVSSLFIVFRQRRCFPKSRYLCGDRLTEADVRLFPTLVRFDTVYAHHFKVRIEAGKAFVGGKGRVGMLSEFWFMFYFSVRCVVNNYVYRGGSRIFMGGRGAKDMCAHANYKHETRSPCRQGSRAPLKGPGSYRFFMLSRAIWVFYF